MEHPHGMMLSYHRCLQQNGEENRKLLIRLPVIFLLQQCKETRTQLPGFLIHYKFMQHASIPLPCPAFYQLFQKPHFLTVNIHMEIILKHGMDPSVSHIGRLLLQAIAHLNPVHHNAEINTEMMQRIHRKAIPIGILVQPQNIAKQRLMLLQKNRFNTHNHRLIRSLIKIVQHKQTKLPLIPVNMQMCPLRDFQMKHPQHTFPAQQIFLQLKTVCIQFIGKRIHRVRLLSKQQ